MNFEKLLFVQSNIKHIFRIFIFFQIFFKNQLVFKSAGSKFETTEKPVYKAPAYYVYMEFFFLKMILF